MLLKNLISFRNDLYFEGAVQADWFYRPDKAKVVVENFVFHGPNTHAVSTEEAGQNRLMDTASFALRLVDKLNDQSGDVNPFTLAIAGYGTGKSHLAVTLSELLSGRSFFPDVFDKITCNIACADKGIASSVRQRLQGQNLVLTLNGMRDFNLNYELLRCAQKALELYGIPEDIIRSLNRAHETAALFLERSYHLTPGAFEREAKERGIMVPPAELQDYLYKHLGQDETAFETVNTVYRSLNGHEIRWDEGVSADKILSTLLQECCGNSGRFDRIVIIFDELGRFLEYASSNPFRAGDSALQQIFEAAQNAEGDVQLVGFIQADIQAYLQRVDKTSNVARYIERFNAAEKIYLSSNLETIFANLIQHVDEDAYAQTVLSYFERTKADSHALYTSITKWLPLKGIWKREEDFDRNIIKNLYPLHPLATYLLAGLTDWLQNRSSLTLLSETIASMMNAEVSSALPPMVYPVDLLRGEFFHELLNAEEQGRQRSQ